MGIGCLQFDCFVGEDCGGGAKHFPQKFTNKKHLYSVVFVAVVVVVVVVGGSDGGGGGGGCGGRGRG